MHGNLRKLRFLPRGWAKRARMASVQSALAGLDPAPAAASPRAGGPPTYPDVRDNRPCDVLRTWRRDLRPVPLFDIPPTTRPPEGCFQSSESVPVLGDAFGGWERRTGVKMHTFRRKCVTKCLFCVFFIADVRNLRQWFYLRNYAVGALVGARDRVRGRDAQCLRASRRRGCAQRHTLAVN